MVETDVDMHVHSIFSDGRGTISENVECAVRRGLSALGCVDHVRRSTTWTLDFVSAVRTAGKGAPLDVRCGIEAKILDVSGRLDLPGRITGVDFVLAADHQVPGRDGPEAPSAVRNALARGRTTPAGVITRVVDGTIAAMRRYPGLTLAHLFSVLPKLGLSEDAVPPSHVHALAEVARTTGATLEISERWRCPSADTVRCFLDAGVPVVLSTDSHDVATIGRYEYARATAEAAQADPAHAR